MVSLFRSLILVLVATTVLAAPVPFDFTGDWTGEAHSGSRHAAVDARFTSTGTAITGSIGLEGVTSCRAQGKYTKRVRLHLKCGVGSAFLVAKLNPDTSTMHGSFTLRGHFVIFTLTKNPS